MAGSNVPAHLKPVIAQAAARYRIPAHVLAGLLDVESNFSTGEVSGAGAFGISQFIPSTAAKYRVQRGSSPGAVRSQIMGAAHLLSDLGYRKNPMFALGAYNGGPGNPQYGYARTVLGDAKRLAGQLKGVAPERSGQNAGAAPGGTVTRYRPPTVSQQSSFDQKGYGLAQLDTQIARLLSNMGAAKDNPLFSTGLFSTADPNPLDFEQKVPVVKQSSYKVNVPGSRGTAPSGGGGGGLHPITGRGLTPGRTDQGYDQGGQGYLHALADGVITRVVPRGGSSGWPGPGGSGSGGFVVLKLDHPVNGHRYVYYAENISPIVRTGQRVRGGNPLAFEHDGFPHSESGWAADAQGTTLARVTSGYSEGQRTPAGRNFTNLVTGLSRRRGR